MTIDQGLKRGLFDWDIEDDEDLFNDHIGEDTMIGLEDYLHTQQPSTKEEEKQVNNKLMNTSRPPAYHYDNTMFDDFMEEDTFMYPESPPPSKVNQLDENKDLDADEDALFELEGLKRLDEKANSFTKTDHSTISINTNKLLSQRTSHLISTNTTQQQSNLLHANNRITQQQQQQQQRKDYSQPPRTGGFLEARCPRTGKPIYFPLQLKSSTVNKRNQDISSKMLNRGKDTTRLLATPVRLMLEQLEVKNIKQAEKLEKDHLNQAKRKNKKKKQIQAESQALWVEKYKPTIFMDLLGDQRVNREALRWVKQWDYCVFQKKPQDESQRDKVMRQYKATFGSAMTDPYEKKKNKEMDEKPKDPLLRPDRKILLLSGPPGFGKTTLAHVIAKHAGYNVVEVNASDDRTGEVVRTKIKSALEMQAILRKPTEQDDQKTTMYTKPNLLIIDEIDGASSGGGSDSFIKQLVDLASIEVPSKTNYSGGFQQQQIANKNNKNKKKQNPLLRPIICICNDVYAPVLRPLRMIAHHIQFRKVPMLTIARRLQDICSNEGLDTDLRALSLLAEMTDGDLRSCLNTLQFIRSKSAVFNREMLTDDQHAGGLGKKDMGRSLFTTWDDLFTAANAKKNIYQRNNQGRSQSDRYVRRLAEAVSTSGDIEKLMQGCFEAYPMMKFHDEAMSKLVQLGDWLDFYDHLSHRANDLHDYSVYGYMSYALVNFHRFFAGSVVQEHRMEYPKVDYEVFAKKKSYDNLIHIFVSGIHPSQRRFLPRDQLVLNVVPRLLRIISPELRPVNKHLIKPQEKETLARLVNVMLEYGMTFTQHRTEEGQFSYTLEPPMEELVWFDCYTQKSVLTSRYAVRQLITQEIETERLRRRELLMGQPYDDIKMKQTKKDLSSKKKSTSKETIQEQVAKDFFGRPIVVKSKKQDQSLSMANDDDLPDIRPLQVMDVITIAYKYHEGFSNAVKKPMNVHMFL
ncbi:uncharacterized protein BX664DRAFT_126288 [Halteromyces radiatus]|uniref:uncharacterized protein n=1 Tax=Halteromyces radiatus TaxID=101107 RepID=UPI00221F1C3D|nr:uncharacterized protein BX664DRAFT_126288 [Halteromyces radiatus]KAI8089045.1 hypothetical protein BX664DRAFT_126288 [Halteromyces radiatus]